MQTTLATRVGACAYRAILDFTALVAGRGACLVLLDQAIQASSLLRVHHLLLSVFVGLALVALAARSALLEPSGVYGVWQHPLLCWQMASSPPLHATSAADQHA
jgi:hypothetical protein